MMRGYAVALLMALALCLPGMARAQMDSREGIALQNQILELRRDLQYLRDQMGRGGGSYAPPPQAYPAQPLPAGGGEMVAQLLDRVARLEEQLRAVIGRQEELSNRLQILSDDVTKQLGDIDFRLQALEGGKRPSAAAPPAMSPQPGNLGAAPRPTAPPPAPPARIQRTPEAMMQEGNAALARRDYATAEAMARDVLALRNSPRGYDAQFLLAQALAGRRDHAGAAIAFDDTYKRARTGRHAQDALVGLAMALTALNERRSACDTLHTLRVEFPTLRADVRDAANTARQRAGCR